MALLEPEPSDEGPWQVTNIDRDVLVVANAGLDYEKVLFRFNISNLRINLNQVLASDFSDRRKAYICFWFGYFYAHLK